MDDIQKEGYVTGIVTLLMTVIFSVVGIHSDLSGISGQTIAILAILLGIATLGCFIWPTTFGQIIGEYLERLRKNQEANNQFANNNKNSTIVVQKIEHVSGNVNTIVESENSGNSPFSVVDGTHQAKGKGDVTALDVEGPAFFKAGTKSTAEGEGTVTATRIGSKRERE